MRSMGNIGTLPMATNASRIIANSVRQVKGRLGHVEKKPWFGENSHLSRSLGIFLYLDFSTLALLWIVNLLSISFVINTCYYRILLLFLRFFSEKNNNHTCSMAMTSKIKRPMRLSNQLFVQDANQSAALYPWWKLPETTQTNSVSNKWNGNKKKMISKTCQK